MALSPGILGFAEADGTVVGFMSCNIGAVQNILYFDPVYGLRDEVVTGKTDGDVINPQSQFWRRGPYIVESNISVPGSILFDRARDGKAFTLKAQFTCSGSGVASSGTRVESYTLSMNAGDMVNTSVNMKGTSTYSLSTPLTGPAYTCSSTTNVSGTIRTWQDVSITSPDLDYEDIASATLTINNALVPIYTEAGLYAIRVGIQRIEGQIAFYGDPTTYTTYSGIDLNIDGRSVKAVFEYPRYEGSARPYIVTLPFKGIDCALP